MKRALWIALAVTACGKKAEPTKKLDAAPVTAPVVADAAPGGSGSAPAPAAGDVEPTTPPPAPVISKGRGDCKTDYAPKPTRDPAMMCKVAGGTFTMGADDPAFPRSAPAHQVRVKPFLIDRHPVTVEQALFFLNTVKDNRCETAESSRCFDLGGDPKQITRDGDVFANGDGALRVPVTVGRLEGAEKYCAWVGKRLPTEAEWEYAARHDPSSKEDSPYPWGNQFEKNRMNCDSAECGDEFDRLSPVGAFDGSNGRGDDSSPFGLHDVLGNSSQLTSTCMVSYETCDGGCADPGPTTSRCKRVLRGSSFASKSKWSRTYARGPAPDGAGFRCAVSIDL